MDSTQIIITRLLKEVQEGQTIALGPGIPQLIKPHLEASIHVVDLTPDTESQSVQLAVVEAEEVSQQGDFCLAPGPRNFPIWRPTNGLSRPLTPVPMEPRESSRPVNSPFQMPAAPPPSSPTWRLFESRNWVWS